MVANRRGTYNIPCVAGRKTHVRSPAQLLLLCNQPEDFVIPSPFHARRKNEDMPLSSDNVENEPARKRKRSVPLVYSKTETEQQSLPGETWLAATDGKQVFDYEVSDHGRIRAKGTYMLGCRSKRPTDREGQVLYDRVYRQVFVHVLVMHTHGSAPASEHDYSIDHIDMNPSNNHISNLRWAPARLQILNQRHRPTLSFEAASAICKDYQENPAIEIPKHVKPGLELFQTQSAYAAVISALCSSTASFRDCSYRSRHDDTTAACYLRNALLQLQFEDVYPRFWIDLDSTFVAAVAVEARSRQLSSIGLHMLTMYEHDPLQTCAAYCFVCMELCFNSQSTL